MDEDLRSRVRQRYAEAARSVDGEESSCCGGSSCCGAEAGEVDLVGESYSEGEIESLPEAAVGASLGCGNPVALAELLPGQVVLDLGSGGGIDVLLSARRVSPGGKAYGLDMTDEMLELARKNQREAGIENVEFLKGNIEEIPLPDNHVDVIISNCVINLSTEKEKVFSEALRVLEPGGRFAVSDMVFLGDKARLPDSLVREVELWAGCITGALDKEEYEFLLTDAGFEEVAVEITQVHSPELVGGADNASALEDVPIASAFIRARKPGA